MPCYTHKMAIVSWPYILWRHFTLHIQWRETVHCAANYRTEDCWRQDETEQDKVLWRFCDETFRCTEFRIQNSLRNRGHNYTLPPIESTQFRVIFRNRCLFSYIGGVLCMFSHVCSFFWLFIIIQFFNQSIFVYYGMTKCRPTTRSKKAIQLVRKKQV